jgi:hypothetical protein
MAKGRKTGGGSRKGRPNKVTGDLRAMILQALEDAGGVNYLKAQAKENPGPFMALAGKCLPKDVMLSGGITLEQLISQARGSQPADS